MSLSTWVSIPAHTHWLQQRNYKSKQIFHSADDCVVDDSLKEAVTVLGGRLTDLELLVQKMRAHISPEGMLIGIDRSLCKHG